MYNSLKHAKNLEAVGFTRAQAEIQVEMITEFVTDNFATRQDMKDLRAELHQVKIDLENKISQVENKIALSEQRLTIKLGTIVSVAIGVAVALTKLI